MLKQIKMSLLITVIVLGLIFDYINGFHDAANSIATVVSSKVLSPFQAVLWASFFNFSAFFVAKYLIGEFGIANTVSKTVFTEYITLPIIFSGLIGSIFWNLLTWWFGIPSSSSHALIGAFAGAAIAAHGFNSVNSETIIIISLFIVVAPLIGMISGVIFSSITLHIAKNSHPSRAVTWFKRLQLGSSGLLALGQGLNDSQKVMGIIAAALISYSSTYKDVPAWLYLDNIDNIHTWVPLACFSFIALGTLTGGWKIIKTMGSSITKITPVEGFAAQVSSAFTLFFVTLFHVPVSTTHVVTGSIVGVGSLKRLSAVRWGVTQKLVVAWIITIPISALVAAIAYWLIGIHL